MTDRLKKSLYYLSILLSTLVFITIFKLIDIYKILCLIYSLVSPIVFGYILAWILLPIYENMKKKIGPKVGIVLLSIIFILFYLFIIWKLLPIVTNNLHNLLDILKNFVNKFENISFLEGIQDIPKININLVVDYCGSMISILVEFIFIHIIGFYILYNYDMINDYIKSLIPKKYKNISLKYIRKLSINMRQYIKGTLLDTLILFLLSSVSYIVVGLKYPVMLAFFCAVTNIIPYVGPYIGGIPAVLVGLSTSTNLGLITFLIILVLQTVESNIINPMIMSKCIKINPILIILFLTIMGKFFGIIGMLFAVPILIAVKLTLDFIKKYKNTISNDRSIL